MNFKEFLLSERDKLNKICDSINHINPEDLDYHDLRFYYVEFKQKQRLEVSEN